MAGRQVGVVVDRDRVLAEAARRLHHHDDVAGAQGGEHDRRRRSGRRTARPAAGPSARPSPSRRSAGSVSNQRAVLGGRDADRVAGQLLLGQPVRVLAAGRDQGVDQRVAVQVGDAGQRAGPVERADVVALRRHRGQQPDDATPGCPGRRRCRSGSAWSGTPTASRRSAARPAGCAAAGRARPRCRRPGRPARGRRRSEVRPVVVDLLERERHGDHPAVELGDRHLVADVERGEPVVVGRPGLARGVVRHRPWRTGTSSAASAPTSQASSSPPACGGRPGREPPAASTVTTRASAVRSASSSLGVGRAQRGGEDRQRAGRRRPRSRRTASRRSAVFPARWCAR